MLLGLIFPTFSGCWYVAAAGVGAAATYYAVDQGYIDTSYKESDREKYRGTIIVS